VSEGHALLKRKKLGPAKARYLAALRTYPSYPRALAGLAQLAFTQGDIKQATSLAQQLVRLRPGQAGYRVFLGDVYKRAGKEREAREAWQAAARLGSGAARMRLKAVK
jgi:Flp pilus assembly protein TadD